MADFGGSILTGLKVAYRTLEMDADVYDQCCRGGFDFHRYARERLLCTHIRLVRPKTFGRFIDTSESSGLMPTPPIFTAAEARAWAAEQTPP